MLMQPDRECDHAQRSQQPWQREKTAEIEAGFAELEPLDEEDLARAVAAVRDAGVEAVAVCLLFGFLHPGHERRVGEAVREALPDALFGVGSPSVS